MVDSRLTNPVKTLLNKMVPVVLTHVQINGGLYEGCANDRVGVAGYANDSIV